MLRHHQPEPVLRRTDYLVVSGPMYGKATPGPIFGSVHKPGAYWIGVHIRHGCNQVGQAEYRPGEVSITPEPSPGSIDPVVPQVYTPGRNFITSPDKVSLTGDSGKGVGRVQD